MGVMIGKKHQRIEKFTAVFTVLAVLLVIVCSACVVKHIEAGQIKLGTTALYSPKFTTTTSRTQGSVSGVYTSQDKKRSLVMIKFDNVDHISTDAGQYRVLLTGSTPSMQKQKLQSNPAAMIYSFGSSGWMGVYLVDQNAFPSQIMYMRVISDSVLSTKQDTEIEENSTTVDGYDASKNNDDGESTESTDGSSDTSSDNTDSTDSPAPKADDNNKDQFDIFFNPGASEAKQLNILNDSQAPSPQQVYREAVLIEDQTKTRKTLNNDILTLRDDLARIDEMTRRVRGDEQSGSGGAGVTLDDSMIPYAIRGDKVEDYRAAVEAKKQEQQQGEQQNNQQQGQQPQEQHKDDAQHKDGDKQQPQQQQNDQRNQQGQVKPVDLEVPGDVAGTVGNGDNQGDNNADNSAEGNAGQTGGESIEGSTTGDEQTRGAVRFDSDGVAKDATLRFVPATVYNGGVDYDWQAGDLSAGKGYLQTMIQQRSEQKGVASMTHAAYFRDLREQAQSGNTYQGALLQTGFPDSISVDDIHWTYHDGTDVYDSGTLSSTSDDARYKAANKAITDLIAAWNTYLQDKKKYQCTDLVSLLRVEDEASVISTATSTNTDKSLLTIY